MQITSRSETTLHNRRNKTVLTFVTIGNKKNPQN